MLEVYNPEIAEEILVRMSGGESLRTICSDDGYPCRRTVTRWAVRDTAGFGARYAAARRAGVESRIEDANEIAAETPTYTDEAGITRIDAAGKRPARLWRQDPGRGQRRDRHQARHRSVINSL